MPCRARDPRRWPWVEIVVRGDSHYGRPEVLDWLERNQIGYVFGPGATRLRFARSLTWPTPVPLRRQDLAG